MRARFDYAASLSHSETGQDRGSGPIGGLRNLNSEIQQVVLVVLLVLEKSRYLSSR
jgi:hypothetical protein